jgi:hypothetical protein
LPDDAKKACYPDCGGSRVAEARRIVANST